MTAIASYSVDSCPVVFGDLLISGPSDKPNQVATPAGGDVTNFFGNSGWEIRGLVQKVVILSPDCALAWSGSYVAARVAIKELREIAAQEELTATRINSFLSSHPDLIRHSASFVGWVREADGCFRQFWHQAIYVFDTDSFGTISIAGSGSDAIKELVELSQQSERNEVGDVNPAARAISSGLSFASILLNAELQGGDVAPTLLNMFGGGYEVAAFFNGRFQKIPENTLLVWEARNTSSGLLLGLPRLIVKQFHHQDVLAMKSAQQFSSDSGVATIKEEQLHLIGPPDRKASKEYLSICQDIPLDSKLRCHCICVFGEDNNVEMIYTRIQLETSEPNTVTIEDEDGQIVLGFNHQFISSVAQALAKRLSVTCVQENGLDPRSRPTMPYT
jgi:hypothetical protein